jgi:hypothetical protein
MDALKRDDQEHSVPKSLRSLFGSIADAFARRDYSLRDHQIEGVGPIEPSTATAIAENVSAYGDSLAPLDASTWEQSCYRWTDGYWQVLVDLTTVRERVSDLTLHAEMREVSGLLLIEVRSVHVP